MSTAVLSRLLDARSPAAPIAVMRITVGIAVLVQLITSGEILYKLTQPTTLRLPYVPWMPALTPAAVWVIGAVWLTAGSLFTVGWRTRWAGAVLVATLMGVILVDQQSYLNRVYLLSVILTLLVLADSGAALSLDARHRGGTHATVPAWPVFLLRAQLSIVYAFTAVAKVNGVFLSGAVLRAHFPTARATAWFGTEAVTAGLVLMAWLTIALELALAVMFWSARFRPAAIALGLLLHGGILALMSAHLPLFVFALASFALYFPFLDARPRSRTVVWDDQCAACATWVRWFRRLDWMRVYEFRASNDPASAALSMTGPDGRYAGFAAIGRILELLPVSFLWAPFLRLPGVRHAGEWLYRRYAARRTHWPAGRQDARAQSRGAGRRAERPLEGVTDQPPQ